VKDVWWDLYASAFGNKTVLQSQRYSMAAINFTDKLVPSIWPPLPLAGALCNDVGTAGRRRKVSLLNGKCMMSAR
jgi:hypothetical protein